MSEGVSEGVHSLTHCLSHTLSPSTIPSSPLSNGSYIEGCEVLDAECVVICGPIDGRPLWLIFEQTLGLCPSMDGGRHDAHASGAVSDRGFFPPYLGGGRVGRRSAVGEKRGSRRTNLDVILLV